MEKIGPYEVIRTIAKGGMGEVFLVKDPSCKREVALKRIRSDYLSNKTIQKRFIKEVLIAAQLVHPNIIPIYSLSEDESSTYYTMPYIQGKTLKQIIMDAKEQLKNSYSHTDMQSSVPNLVNIFTTVCEAVAFAHKQHIIHRDLKPENILVGRHGEVIIFDWGVADKIENIQTEDIPEGFDEDELSNLTSPGKVIGTLSFLAPERFKNQPSNYLTDIYSLGVMLYMILTLKLPFRRKKLKIAKQNIDQERFKNPIDIAPYRDIPHALVGITKKCLQPDPKRRYQSIEDLLKDLRDFTEGHSEWIPQQTLDYQNKEHWAFNESLLVSNHKAISSPSSALKWQSLMISKEAFEENTQLKVELELNKNSSGIGLLMNSPSAKQRVHIIDGYHLWLSANPKKPSLLYRNNVEVLRLPDIILKQATPYQIRFEKINNRILCFLDNALIFSYLSYLPLMGTHVGLLFQDQDFKLSPISVSVASPSLIISCLEIPNAFLQQKNFKRALIEYQKIGSTFTGRHESREAFFRAGLTVIEQALTTKTKAAKLAFFDQALQEFEKLKHTPGAPLEYLGKSLVYQHQEDVEEELKCLELALRRYPNHPLLYLIYDHIIYRLYQSSHSRRLDTHKFIFLALRYNAYAKHKQVIDPLILNLTDRKRLLYFLEELPREDLQSHYLDMILNLGFMLEKTYVYKEILETYSLDAHFTRNIFIILIMLGEQDYVKEHLSLLPVGEQELIRLLFEKPTQKSFDYIIEAQRVNLTPFYEAIFFFLIDQVLLLQDFNLAQYVFDHVHQKHLYFNKQKEFYSFYILVCLLNKNGSKARALLEKQHKLFEEWPHAFHFLKGCLLSLEGSDQAETEFKREFEGSLSEIEVLACRYICGDLKLNQWKKEAFRLEQRMLYKYLFLYYKIAGDTSKASQFYKFWRKS